ncbi:hypothetical protein AB3N59_08085 [Leptospira sp. WS92.C1]
MNTCRNLLMGKLIPILILSFAGLVPTSSLFAQVTCTGAACSVIPNNVSSQFNGLENEIRTKYLDPVVRSMVDSAVLTTINSSMMGPGTINRFQIGAGVSGAGIKNEDIQIQYAGINLPNLPNGGASLSPSLMAGVNLGWLAMQGQSNQPDENRSFLHRINIFVHGYQGNLGQGDLKSLTGEGGNDFRLAGNFNSFGATVRFQLLKERYTRWDLFGFTGLSLGVGFHRKTEELSLGYTPSQFPKVAFGPASGRWDADFSLDYRARTESLPIDIRTGVRLFYILTLFVGGGISQNTGSSQMNLLVQGPMTLTLDAAAAGLPLQFLQGYQNASSGDLSIRTGGEAKAKNSLNYAVGGLEINLLTFKILLEGLVSEKFYSANVGVKFAL